MTRDGGFERIVEALDPEVAVITVPGDPPEGCVVGFHCQAGITPPRYLVCISKTNRTYRAARVAEAIGVHLLPAEATGLAELFGGETGDEVQKFDRCEWSVGPGGVPVLDGAAGWFAGRVVDRFDVGDHVAFLLSPLEPAEPPAEAELLRIGAIKQLDPGHEA